VTSPPGRGGSSALALYTRLLPYVRREWFLLAITVAAMLLGTLVTLARPWPMQVIVDSVLGSRPAPGWLTHLTGPVTPARLLGAAIGLMIAALFAGQLLALAQEYAAQLLGQRLVLQLRCDLYAKLQRLSLRFHEHSSVGDLLYRITADASALQNVITYGFVTLAIQALTAIAIASTILAFDVRLGLTALAVVPILGVSMGWFSSRIRTRTSHLAEAESTLYTTASETLGSIRAVKSFTMEEIELERFADRARTSQEAYVGVTTLSKLGGLATEAVGGLATALVIYFGARSVLAGELTVGELLVFVAYIAALYGPVAWIAGSALVIQRSSVSIERVLEILDLGDERGTGSATPGRTAGRLDFVHVSFSHDGERLAVRDVSFTVEPGEMVALVGRAGAGKTTLLSLLLRFYAPQSGRVLLDGTDLGQLDLAWLRRQIALVPQEPILFSTTIAENIAYGRPGATREAVVAAARAAGLHDFIQSLSEDYSTKVGERGARLSGGQRQMMSIARAFLKDAPILLLDEPTSNLDGTSERHVFESLNRLAAGRTLLVIAHRLTTARRADRILVVKAGQIVEAGTHGELLARGGAYAELCRDQLLTGAPG
jgi:ABC-type multidrug transport system fused ATPase/permease subunit